MRREEDGRESAMLSRGAYGMVCLVQARERDRGERKKQRKKARKSE